MVKFREHRALLAESMATVVEVVDLKDLLERINKDLGRCGAAITEEQLKIEPYGYDNRIGWNTHIVTAAGYGVFGFTDGPLKSNDGV